METIAVSNQKGGVGKTTTATNLAAALAKLGKRALLVDLDPQANATQAFGVMPGDEQLTIYDALRRDRNRRVSLDRIIVEREGVQIAPGSIAVAELEIELLNSPTKSTILRNALVPVQDMFDFCLIDCAPTLTTLTITALCAADWVLIPLQTQTFSLRALTALFGTIQEAQEANPSLAYLGLVPTFVDRTQDARNILAAVKEELADYVTNTAIPYRVAYKEAQSAEVSIFAYRPGDRKKQEGVEDARNAYLKLAEEVIRRATH